MNNKKHAHFYPTKVEKKCLSIFNEHGQFSIMSINLCARVTLFYETSIFYIVNMRERKTFRSRAA